MSKHRRRPTDPGPIPNEREMNPKHVMWMILGLLCTVQAEDINPVQKHTQTVSEGDLYVVDPWIRPPKGAQSLEAVGKAGNFDGYPTIQATESDRLSFISRPIERNDAGMEGDNVQRHGVYVVTDLDVYDEEIPCPPLEWTEEQPCQVTVRGLNETSCPGYRTLFPMVEVRGNGGYITYTTPELHEVTAEFGRVKDGKKEVVLACPWIQSRSQEGGPTQSHCNNNMFVRVLVDSRHNNSNAQLPAFLPSVLFSTILLVLPILL